jgi:biotin carboxylase
VTPPSVVVLEAAGPESRALALAAAVAGYQVHAVTDPATYASYPPSLRDHLASCLSTDLARPDQALDDVVTFARRVGAAAVLTANEYLTEMLAHVNAALGLPGNDPARARSARDKAAMSQAFAAHGVTAPETRLLDDEGTLNRLLADGSTRLPCVVKPADAAGSAGVTVVHRRAEATAAWRAARTARRMYGHRRPARVLVQEHLDGAEFSVESVTQDGRTTHLCITAKSVTSGAHRVETGHSLPAALPAPVERAVHRQVERAIAAVGIRNSASHTEVMIDPAGRCAVIEIAARLGAGRIGFLLHHALGIDPWAALVDIALGRPADLTATRRDHAAIRYLTAPNAGRLAAIRHLPTPGPGLPDVHLRCAVGDRVEPPSANSGRLGHIIVTGPDAGSVEQRADRLLGRVAIDVDPEPAEPRPQAVTTT